jgi:DNA-binding MarR family transcriptional regulator
LVSLNNKDYYFYEEIEIKIFKVLHEIIEQGLDSIDLETFDEKVFNGLGHKTHITTKRNEIIDRINNKLGFEFITKEKSQEDKRRKFIKISF